MITTEIDITIERQSDEVFALLSDFSRNPEWQNGMQSCEWTSEPPLRVGSTYDQRAGFLGKEILSSFQVVEYEEGRRVKATTVSGSFPITFTRWVEPTGDRSTRVRALIEGDASGFFRLMEPLMAPLVRRSIRRDYRRLKDLLEAGS